MIGCFEPAVRLECAGRDPVDDRPGSDNTQIQFFRERLDNHFIGYLLFPILVVLVVSYLLLGVVAAGAVINGITAGTFEPYGWFEAADHGVPNSLASGVICLVVLSYVFLGGIRCWESSRL